MNTIRSVIFSFENSLVDIRDAINQCLRNTLVELGIGVPVYHSREDLMALTPADILRSLTILQPWKFKDAVRRFRDDFIAVAAKRVKPFPGVEETLGKLRQGGIPLAVTFSGMRVNLDPLLQMLDLGKYFDFSVCSDEVLRPKPYPEMALCIQWALQSDPAHTLVVGGAVPDLQMGIAAGCPVCAVAHGISASNLLRACRPNWMVERLPDILPLLKVREEMAVPAD